MPSTLWKCVFQIDVVRPSTNVTGAQKLHWILVRFLKVNNYFQTQNCKFLCKVLYQRWVSKTHNSTRNCLSLGLRVVASSRNSAQETPTKRRQCLFVCLFIYFLTNSLYIKYRLGENARPKPEIHNKTSSSTRKNKSSPTRHNKPIIIRILRGADAGISDHHSTPLKLVC